MQITRSMILLALAMLFAGAAHAEPSATGQTGLIQMPDGRVEPDGTLRIGVSHMAPYSAAFGSVTLVPWLEVSARFTRIADVPGFGTPGAPADLDYGSYKDKAFGFKLRLLEESEWLPALAFGRQDFHGTRAFGANYLAASKRIEAGSLGAFDLALGAGDGRLDGAFGGVRWYQPWLDGVALVAEYDAYDYENDIRGQILGEVERTGGLGLGIEYRTGWWGFQAAHQDGHFGVNASLSVPLQLRSFTPKVDEPKPVEVALAAPASYEAWLNDPTALAPVLEALAAEEFSVSRLRVVGDTLHVAMGPGRMSTIGRAAGRAARVIALAAPPEVTRAEITLVEAHQPQITYSFNDLALLRGWWEGRVAPDALQPTLAANYPSADGYAELRAEGLKVEDILGPRDDWFDLSVGPALFAFPTSIDIGRRDPLAIRIAPVRFGFVFNDPNGALRYDLYTYGFASKTLADGLYAAVSGRITLAEDVSKTVGTSNSVLPRVRSESVNYRRQGRRAKLLSLHLTHLANPADRVYTRATAGILEEMFAGAGGEVLYLPQAGNWAADFSAYGVRQRDFEGHFGFFDYETVTALASFYYRVPSHGLTFTTRVGRFLAKDDGVRFELKRRFLSGFEVGAWYSHTDARDITSPGRPDNPYRDKGVFLRYAVGPFLPRDSNMSATIAIAPWARDPGQMLHGQSRLYEMHERRLLLNLEDLGPWSDFGQ